MVGVFQLYQVNKRSRPVGNCSERDVEDPLQKCKVNKGALLGAVRESVLCKRGVYCFKKYGKRSAMHRECGFPYENGKQFNL